MVPIFVNYFQQNILTKVYIFLLQYVNKTFSFVNFVYKEIEVIVFVVVEAN